MYCEIPLSVGEENEDSLQGYGNLLLADVL